VAPHGAKVIDVASMDRARSARHGRTPSALAARALAPAVAQEHGELVVSDHARVVPAGRGRAAHRRHPRLSKDQCDSARVAAWWLRRFFQDRTRELIIDRAMLDRGRIRE
jgi:hypothetical protein